MELYLKDGWDKIKSVQPFRSSLSSSLISINLKKITKETDSISATSQNTISCVIVDSILDINYSAIGLPFSNQYIINESKLKFIIEGILSYLLNIYKQ